MIKLKLSQKSIITMMLVVLFSMTLSSCIQYSKKDGLPAPTTTRGEVIRVAKLYCDHQWYGHKHYSFHGEDPDGIRLDTPDDKYVASKGVNRGWWKIGEFNKGIPYQWGGFDTPYSFDQKLGKGFYAGDAYSDEKRKLLDDGVSKYACGIDCSGFVSRCWRLPRSYSTREIQQVSVPLKSWKDLKPGDILNKHNAHVMIFSHYIDSNRMHVYQAGVPPYGLTMASVEKVNFLKKRGYKPYSYKNIRP